MADDVISSFLWTLAVDELRFRDYSTPDTVGELVGVCDSADDAAVLMVRHNDELADMAETKAGGFPEWHDWSHVGKFVLAPGLHAGASAKDEREAGRIVECHNRCMAGAFEDWKEIQSIKEEYGDA